LRYLRWGRDGEAVQPEKSSGVENCLKCAQNPQRQVHALLGVFALRKTLCLKKIPPPTKQIFTHNLIFDNHQKILSART
jgi:hypothetical protein